MTIYTADKIPEKVGSSVKDPEIAVWLPAAPVLGHTCRSTPNVPRQLHTIGSAWMYSIRSPLDFEMNLFEGSVCSEAVRCGVLAGRAVNPAAANRSSLSDTRCVSDSQLQSAMQAERHLGGVGRRRRQRLVDAYVARPVRIAGDRWETSGSCDRRHGGQAFGGELRRASESKRGRTGRSLNR
jgi:hypothetical protein